jgi:hypothetical protein
MAEQMTLVQDRFGNTLHFFWTTRESEIDLKPFSTPEMNDMLDGGGDPYKLLGIAIILKAIKDLKAGCVESYYWLMSDCELFCDEIGLDYKVVQHWAIHYYGEYVASGYLQYLQEGK